MSATANPMAIAPGVLTRGIAHDEFDSIVADNQQRIYRVLLALVRDADLAASLTQDCFIRAYERREQFRGEAAVSTWLVHIAVNIARDHVRNRRQGFWRSLFSGRDSEERELALDGAPDLQPTAERQLLAREQANTVWEIVGTLPHQQREAFVLRFAEEMPLEEIAAALNVKIGTVKSHLARAVAVVRAQLKEKYQ